MTSRPIEKLSTVFIDEEAFQLAEVTLKPQQGMAKADDFNYAGRLESETDFPIAVFQCMGKLKQEVVKFIKSELDLKEGDTLLFDPNPSMFVDTTEESEKDFNKGVAVSIFKFKNEDEKDRKLELSYEFYVKKEG